MEWRGRLQSERGACIKLVQRVKFARLGNVLQEVAFVFLVKMPSKSHTRRYFVTNGYLSRDNVAIISLTNVGLYGYDKLRADKLL